MDKKAIVIGAGPAGLTAAYELLKRTGVVPVILEKSDMTGGISRTIDYKGNRMDMGPHRFFSKSDRVMDWWLNIMPLEADTDEKISISYQNKSREITGSRQNSPDKKMLVIRRLTRIYFLRKFFAYPIQLSLDTLRTLGLMRTIRILFSFLWVRLFPRNPEKSLEDFIINKFGRELYLLFFKDYTEKVWGIAPSEISAEWGAQRIKGVSLSKAILEAVRSMRRSHRVSSGSDQRVKRSDTGQNGAPQPRADIGQKDTETSLIEQFLYPKKGPGALWEEVADQIRAMGGQIYFNQDVKAIRRNDDGISSVETEDATTGERRIWEGDYFFSTMPVQELIAGMGDTVPSSVREVAAGLQYRDFINVGILLKRLSDGSGRRLELKDNWIYIQERDVKVGRLMIYNNWGPGMIADPTTTWIGMEYFCNKTDRLWAMNDEYIKNLAIEELTRMDLACVEDVLDATVRRMEKTYPAYFGTYERFGEIRQYINRFGNLFCIGRNGMHKYNNADHSMLTAMVSVDNILAGVTSKENLWSINTEQEYHEEKQTAQSAQPATPQAAQSAYPGESTTTKLPAGLDPAPSPSAKQPSLAQFVIGNKVNRRYLGIGLAAVVIQFIVFKILYPFPDFFSDSYSYIEAAANHWDVNIWPIGYSKFLEVFHMLTNSDLALISFQYFLLMAACFLLFFSIRYFFQLTHGNSSIIFIFLFFNPLFLYLCNYVSSDSLFTSLSLLWLTHLFWIIKNPQRYQIITQAILLFALFTIRYNAIYYPLIATLAFLFSKHPTGYKIAGVSLGVIFILFFVNSTIAKTEQETGRRQFSVFSGWQLANNALYVYPHLDNFDKEAFPTEESRAFNSRVRKFFDTVDPRIADLSPTDGAFYMRYPKSPLKEDYRMYLRAHPESGEFRAWGAVAPSFNDFGTTIIRVAPASFFQYYLLPNAQNYFIPPIEKLELYNIGSDKVPRFVAEWFDWRTNKLKVFSPTFQGRILFPLPVIILFANFIYFFSVISFSLKRQWKNVGPVNRKILALILTTILLNICFSVIASPIVLRYQAGPLIILIVGASSIISLLDEKSNETIVSTAHPFNQKKIFQA